MRLAVLLWTLTLSAAGQQYDTVISGGRVIDPETSLDAIRNVGIQGGKIAAISEAPLEGRTSIDAHGLVVTAGVGIATDFMPSTLVAQLLGVREFGLGSTLAFRAEDLKAAGGFAALADYLPDDYQLAKRICTLGKRALLSRYIVETALGDSTWRGMWQHQLRWALLAGGFVLRSRSLPRSAGSRQFGISPPSAFASYPTSAAPSAGAIASCGLTGKAAFKRKRVVITREHLSRTE